MPPTPRALLAHRLSTLHRRMARQKLGGSTAALLITNPRDIRYLTGFVGDDSWALIPAAGSTVRVLSDFRFQEQIQHEAPHVRAVMRKKSLAHELAALADKLGLRRVALQPAYVTLAQRKAIAREVGTARLVEAADGLLMQRSVKDESEIAAIKKSLAIQQDAYLRTLRTIKPGQTESQIAARLEYEMRTLGADGVSFPSIVAADANASLPHAIPGPRKVKNGGILLIDWGSKFRGYCSDMTRVVALGKMPPRIAEIYRVTLDAQLAGIAAIAPGKKLFDIDKAARDLIAKAGYGKYFGHSLGHGIGLDIHEQPTLSQRSQGVLEPGQVVTVEPGIYLPGVGGVRIEDDVLVTEKGRRVLSQLPKDLNSAII